MRRIILLASLCLFCALRSHAQELRANVSVMAGQVGSGVDRKVFNTLQTALSEFLNGRRWSTDAYTPGERIECNFLINITEAMGNNTYRATLTVQANRPVYNTGYNSTILNTQDNNVVFKYVEFQPLEFNEQRIAGNDPLVANLTAILAYYNYIILGLDYDSFSPRGGDIFFKKALNIVTNAPDGKDISGWKAFEGNRNRYWLQDNLLNVKFSRFHEVMYMYHRMGLDQMYEDVNKGRSAIMNCLNLLMSIHQEMPNSMLMAVFFNAKNDELLKIFGKAPPQEKARAVQMMSQLDVPNANKYQQLK
ncbi:type IX secretion system protein PorD [Chitinophaga lutea]